MYGNNSLIVIYPADIIYILAVVVIHPADSTLAVTADEDTTKLSKGSERGDDDLVIYCPLTI